MSLGMIIGAADAGFSCILYLVLLGGAFAWLFWNRSQLEQTPEQAQLDPLITRQFLGGGVYYPDNQKPIRPWRPQAWMGLLVATPGLLLLLGGPSFASLFPLLGGLALAAWCFFYADGVMTDRPAWANFQPDHVVVTTVGGSRTVFVLGPRVSITLELERLPLSPFGDKATGRRSFLTIAEGASSVRLPLAFGGSAQFLSLCRKEGVRIGFSPTTPKWFVDAMNATSARPTEASKAGRGGATPPMVSLSCPGCGSTALYPKSGAGAECQFCGTSGLEPAAKA
jgi:hypothetical protein